PPSADFGNEHVGTTSATKNFVVTNVGSDTLTISSIQLGGSDAAQYTTSSNTCNQPLAPNATCSIDVAFGPTTSGNHNAATLDVASDGAPAVDQVSLSGTGILGAITSSMNSHDFGNQRVGTTSAAQRVTVTNTGTDILSISGAVLAGIDGTQYTIANDGCTNQQLRAGSKCSLDVAFRPTSTGSHPDARIDVTSDAANSVLHVTLTGTGTLPTVTPSLSAHDFGTQRVGTTSAAQRFTINNSGLGALNVSSVSLTGSGADQYTVLQDRCSAQTVAAGQACTIDVSFSPSATGAHSATLAIRSDAPSSPDQLFLSGTGAQPALALGPTQRDFGTVTIGTSGSPMTFTVSNTGGTATTISGATVTGADAPQYPRTGDHCSGQALAPGATCTVQVVFRPTSTGVHNRASLQVSSDAGTVSATLTGRAGAPSNVFTIGHLKIRSNGTAQFDITVRAAGYVSAVTSAPKLSVFGKVRVRAGRAGTVHVTVTPSSAGRKLVKHHHGALRIQLSVGFTPTFGRARTQTFHRLFVAK
ncbi:MAG: choice-of-anchor D domain-containing protein, partial [Solirubrobacteraceae bacterium]